MATEKLSLHAKEVAVKASPRGFNSVNLTQLHRVQSFAPAFTRPNEAVYELGREDECDRDFSTPEVTVGITSFEYGSMIPWGIFSHQDPTTVTEVELFDMDAAPVDFVALKRNTSQAVYETIYTPKCYLNRFSLGVSDKDAKLEQTWEFAGDDKMTFANNNKHFIEDEHTITAGEEASGTYTVSPVAVLNPDTSKYTVYAAYISGSTQTLLTEATSFTTDGTTITEGTVSMVEGDVWVLHYTATTGSSFSALDDSNPYFVKANQCKFRLMSVATEVLEVARLQSATIDASINRTPYGELGSKEIKSRPIDSRVVTVTLGKLATDITLDEVLRGKASGDSYGVIDIRKYIETLEFWVDAYTDSDKGTFLCRYIAHNVKPISGGTTVNVNTQATSDRVLETDNLTFTNSESQS